jgi:hypothetical protein
MSTVTQRPEPRVSCGEDTSIGSAFYSDRLVNRDDGESGYLCSCAHGVLWTVAHGRGMPDAQRRELEKAAFVFGSVAPGGHLIPSTAKPWPPLDPSQLDYGVLG